MRIFSKEEKPKTYEYPKDAIFRTAEFKQGSITYTVIRDSKSGENIPVDREGYEITNIYKVGEKEIQISPCSLIDKWSEYAKAVNARKREKAREDAASLETKLLASKATTPAPIPTPEQAQTASPAPAGEEEAKPSEPSEEYVALLQEHMKQVEKAYKEAYNARLAEQEKALDESAAKVKNLEDKLTKEGEAHKAELARQKETMEKAYLGQLNDALAEQKKALADSAEETRVKLEEEIHAYKIDGSKYRTQVEDIANLNKTLEDNLKKSASDLLKSRGEHTKTLRELEDTKKLYQNTCAEQDAQKAEFAELARQNESYEKKLAEQEKTKETLEECLKTTTSDLQKFREEQAKTLRELEDTKKLYQNTCVERERLNIAYREYKAQLAERDKIIKTYEARAAKNREALMKAIGEAESRLPQAGQPKKPAPAKG